MEYYSVYKDEQEQSTLLYWIKVLVQNSKMVTEHEDTYLKITGGYDDWNFVNIITKITILFQIAKFIYWIYTSI